jgi:hypothetical protein
MNKKRILLVEDDAPQYLKILRSLKKDFGNNVEVLPSQENVDQANLSVNKVFIGKLIEGNFAEISAKYSKINVYIVDVYLLDDVAQIGIDFSKYIINHVVGDYDVIIISNTEINDEILRKNPRVIFMGKTDPGSHFERDLAKKVGSLIGAIDATKSTFGERLHDFWESLRKIADRTIDKLIYISFWILLVATTLYAVKNILLTIWESSSSDSHKSETLILQTSEHIFLYLLPIFIVFGFFHYYKNNSRISLLGGFSNRNDSDNATKTMNLTKMLFISSIISYVLIKVIEEIFVIKTMDLTRLISFGLLLLMLMAYFIFLERHEKPSRNE